MKVAFLLACLMVLSATAVEENKPETDLNVEEQRHLGHFGHHGGFRGGFGGYGGYGIGRRYGGYRGRRSIIEDAQQIPIMEDQQAEEHRHFGYGGYRGYGGYGGGYYRHGGYGHYYG